MAGEGLDRLLPPPILHGEGPLGDDAFARCQLVLCALLGVGAPRRGRKGLIGPAAEPRNVPRQPVSYTHLTLPTICSV
eukprot:11611630-Alexandrium_andersonii.AAC.1